MGMSQTTGQAVAGKARVWSELKFLMAEAEAMTGWRQVAQTMEVRKLRARFDVICLSEALERAKRQLWQDVANVHNSHAGRMFMAADSHKTIAYYESKLAEARKEWSEANSVEVLQKGTYIHHTQTVAGETLQYITRNHVHNTICAHDPRHCR